MTDALSKTYPTIEEARSAGNGITRKAATAKWGVRAGGQGHELIIGALPDDGLRAILDHDGFQPCDWPANWKT